LKTWPYQLSGSLPLDITLTKWRHDTQQNDTQHYDTQHKVLICDNQHNKTVIMLSYFIYCYAECYNTECHYAECHYAECHYAECRYAIVMLSVVAPFGEHSAKQNCHYAECHVLFIFMLTFVMLSVIMLSDVAPTKFDFLIAMNEANMTNFFKGLVGE
jgi:hypothetical protein